VRGTSRAIVNADQFIVRNLLTMWRRTISLLFLALIAVPASNAQDNGSSPPRVLSMATPTYASELKKRGIGGEVVLDFYVGPDGLAHNATILSSPDRCLSAAVLDAVKKWRFAPGIVNGTPVTTHLRVPISFDPKKADSQHGS
jgi:TonB family protein